MTHTPECRAATARDQAAVAAWNAAWPNHCPECRGYGQFSYPASREDPGGCEPCEACVGTLHCARCGNDGLNPWDGDGPCAYCGWKPEEGQPEIDGYCDCGMTEAEDAWCPDPYPAGHCQCCGRPGADLICTPCQVRGEWAADAARERRGW